VIFVHVHVRRVTDEPQKLPVVSCRDDPVDGRQFTPLSLMEQASSDHLGEALAE